MTHTFWKGFTKQAGCVEVACIGVVDGDKILMGKRRDNDKWTNPGGHMEPGETPLEGAVRELYEETGIKADPKDLEHLKTKMVTKPGGKELKIHAFKYDAGKQKTTMSGDPDKEVYRWTWQPLPLRGEVSGNLHVPKENVLFDAMGIKYGAVRIMNGDHYEHLMNKAADEAGNPAGFMRALHEHFHILDSVIPVVNPGMDAEPEQNGDTSAPAEKDHTKPPPEQEGDPMAKAGALARMNIRKAVHHPNLKKIKEELARHIAGRGGQTHDEHGDCV